MRVFQGFETLPQFVHPAVTVGSYDGVHLGHRALIDRLVAEARANDGESIVLTFDPHPRITLGRAEGLFLLTTLEEKIALLEQLGVDNVIVIPFNGAFSALSGAEFIDQYLINRIGARTLVAGYNHRFGHDRIDSSLLADSGRLKVVTVDQCNVGGEHVSSTVIRRLVEAGRTAEAERLLGHPLHSGGRREITVIVNPERTECLTAELCALWRASAKASHDFLMDADLAALMPEVRAGISGVETLIVAENHGQAVAFMGIEARKVEMLFVDPAYFGQGIGRRLITRAIERFGAEYVDVNEQNPNAAAFYRRMGFEVFDRAELDGQGRPFPILQMKLAHKTEK